MKFLWNENDQYSDRNQDFNIKTPAPPRTTQSIILMIGVPLRFERKQSHLLFSLVVVCVGWINVCLSGWRALVLEGSGFCSLRARMRMLLLGRQCRALSTLFGLEKSVAIGDDDALLCWRRFGVCSGGLMGRASVLLFVWCWSCYLGGMASRFH